MILIMSVMVIKHEHVKINDVHISVIVKKLD